MNRSLGNPKKIIVLSGKRKSGKDYVADLLLERFGTEKAVIIRLSAPLKEIYARENGLEYERLLDSSPYKELYRLKMIQWSEIKRHQDPGYFCRLAIERTNTKSKKIWIVSDARRKSDIDFFSKRFRKSTYFVRINASEEVRKKRGWKRTPDIDDGTSECDLDYFEKWNFELNNNNSEELLDGLNKFIDTLKLK